MDWLITQLSLTSPWEAAAIVLAILYLVLAAHQSQWCWGAAIISCSIYASLMFSVQLYMEFLLQLAYIALAVYGWWQWQFGAGSEPAVERPEYSWRWHISWILVLAGVAALIAVLLERYTDADAVWLDSFTTVFSLFATWLLTRKLFSNWLYWLVIDSIYVYLYASKGFVATGGLFAVYVVLVFYAMWQWQRGKKAT